MPDLRQALRDFVATSNSGKYATEEELMSKFPELQGYDIQVLRDFVTTSNSGKYSDEETLFSKFPEFGITGKTAQQQTVQQEPAKKKEPTVSSSEGGWSDWFKPKQEPKQEYKPTTPIPGTDYNAPQNAPIVFTGQQEEDPYGIKRMEQQMFGEGGTAMPKSDYFAQVGAKEKKEAKIGLEYAIAKEETKKLQQKEQTDLDKKLAENLAIKQSPEFANSLNKIDQSIYTQDDYINNLNREYQKYGVTVTKGGWWGEKLIARTDDGKKMIEINTLIEDPNERSKDLNSLKKFISENAKISKEEDFLSQALRAKNMRSTARINDDGTQSTVKFISFDNKVIPTLFPKTDKWYESYSSDKKDWIELPFDEALKEATKRGEVFTFKTNEEAEAFAKGAWKDISKLDVEGDKFYRSKGRDYITEKKRWERYDEIDDIINFYEGDQKDMAEFKKQNPTLFVNGMFRTDIDQYIGDLKKERESLRPLVKDMTFFSQEGTSEKSRMDFDFHLAEMQKKASSDAAAMVREAKAKVAQSNQESMEIFGVPIDKLTEDKEAMRKNPQAYVKAVSDYTNALMLGQTATIKYTEAQTYFDAKINKDINNRFTEDGEAVYNSIVDGYNNGLIGDQLLALTIPGYSATSGFSSKEDAARYMAEKLAGMSQGQSRVMTRLESAKTARDWWDVMMDDPFEGMALAVSGSISQMLPYGTKITAATTAAGAGTGALAGLAGGPFAPVTVTGGAISGGLLGFRTGQALTGAATEYTTAFMDAVRNQDYNPLDPKSLEAALNDQDVWDEAARVGAARGIPIAVVDYLTAGLAGNILKPSKLASRGTKITRGIAENVVLDPLMESGGEFAAQTSEMALGTGRKELSWSEIALEGIGSMGTNTPNFLVNTYKNAKENTDIDLAYSLTNARNVAKEKVSDERISNWANNMFKLGKIDESVNQRIQENVGLRRSAKEVLSVGEQKGKASPEVTARTMELLSAKEQLSATKNRQEVYGQEIRAINEELAAIGKSKQIPAKEQQVNLEGLVELVPESERGAVGEYMIDGKRYTKQQFLDRLNSIKPERLSRVKIAIKGDPEVSQTFKEKIDAIQKQTTGEVSVQPEAGAGQEVEVGGPEAKPKITPEESKRKEDLLAALEATDKDVIAIGDELLDRKEAQAELEAITQKEQAPVTEQGGMEQAEGLGTQLETVAKEEQTPAKMTTTEVLTSTPTETKASVTFIAPDGNEVALEGNEQVAAQLYDDAMAVAEEQRTPEQNDIIQKMQPIVAAAPAVEVTPAEITPTEVTPTAEVTPAEQQFTEQDRARKAELEEAMRKADKRRKNITVGETTMPKAEAKAELDALNQKEQAAQQLATPAVEVAPAELTPTEEVVERTPEQEADLLEELLTGKKKEPVAEEVVAEGVVAEEKVEGKKLSDMIRGLEIKGPGGLQSNLLGIPIAIWNSAVKTTAAAIDANVAVAKAIQQGVKEIKDWINKNNPSLSLNDAKIKNTILVETYAGVIKTARENNIKNEGLTAYFKRKGLSDVQISVLFKAEQKEATELSEKTIPGYTKLMNRINGIIERGRRNGKTDDDIMKGVIANVESRSPEYANANDQQREQIIRDIRKLFGKKEKAAPSAEKITGKAKPKKVTVDEMTALKDQLRLEAKAAREAKGDLNTKRKMLADAINKMAKKGSISVRQAKAIVNRISSVNLDNPVMVERLLDYAENIFNDADYDTRIQEVRKLQDKVKKVNHVSMKQTVKEFASINPERIPANKLLEYIQALDDMSTRTPFYQKMNDMFDEVMSYKSESKEFDEIKTLQALNDKLESIEINKVKSVEDYVALIRDINSFKKKAYQLLQEGVITKEEYDEVIDNVGKDQAAVEKKYEKELATLKEKLIQEINGLKPKVHPDFTPEEAALINKYLELSDADLASLSPEDLYILNDLLSNIKEDLQLDYFRLSEIVSKAYTNSGGQKLATQINASKFNKSSEQGRKLLAEYEASFWEGLLGLGRATSGALQKFVVAPFNRAIASYENYLKESYSDFLKLKKKYNMKDYNMHRLGILTTYLQEYMAQFDSKNENVKDIGSRDWFGEIINNPEMRDGYQSAKASALRLIGMGSTELKTIEKIYKSLPKDANGKVNPKAVYDSFMANDGKYLSKEEKAFFDDVMAWKQKNLTTKQKAANEMNGSSFKEIPFHMMRVRLDRGAKQISPTAEGGSGTVRIEAGTGKERSSQRVGPIMTNFEQIFTENLEQTGRNYYLQEAINDINNTLAVAKKDLKGEKVGLINTISGTISEALNFEFDKTDAQVLFKGLLAARAAETLFNPIRTAVELTSAIISYPFRAKTPEGYRALFGKQGQMKKLLEFTDSPIRLRDNINKAIDISDGKIKPKNKFEKAVNYLSGLPERTMLITSWIPTFNNEFKEITGEKFDINKFNSNEKYRQKYGKAIKEAAAVADAQTEKIIGSTTKAGGRRDIRIAPKILANVIGLEGKVKKNTNAGQILGFFSNYPFREITEFFNGFREAAEVYRQGDKLKAISQLQKPLGVVLNVAAYGYLSAIVYAAKLMLLGDEEDEEKGEAMLKELLTFGGFMDEFQGNAISLAASKYAAGGRALLQIGATIAYESTSDEAQKAKIKKILKNSVFVDPLPVEKAQGYGGQKEILSAVASYVPQFVLGAKRYEETLESIGEIKNIYKKFEEGGLDALSEDDGSKILGVSIALKSVQALLNISGMSLPMYNDIKMYMRGVKKEAGVGDIKIATEEEGKISKEAAYKNYKTLEEFQLADPEGYDEYSKEGGLLDQYRKQEKEKREKSKDKRESELDVKYGRLPFKENSMREDALQGYPTIEKLKEANPELHDRLSEEGGALYKLRQHNKRMEELREKALGGYTSEADFKALNPTKYEKYISEGGLLYKYNKIKEVFKSDDRSEKMSEAEYKRRFPKEYRENYGPGSDYQLESYDRKSKKRAEEREKMREARSYGY